MTKTATPPHPDHDKTTYQTADQLSAQFKEYEGIEEDADYENWENLEKEIEEGKYDLSGLLMN
jgi:hypothetical protein